MVESTLSISELSSLHKKLSERLYTQSKGGVLFVLCFTPFTSRVKINNMVLTPYSIYLLESFLVTYLMLLWTFYHVDGGVNLLLSMDENIIL